SLVISKGGFFNGNITKMNDAVERVLAIDEKRASSQPIQQAQQFATR
ncbi:MAG: hypothetical protein H0W69_09620, partial [Gemmatimonadaceae bacterium]|nr:hypothetical protein [Gemmatimonadaceae bacterium]